MSGNPFDDKTLTYVVMVNGENQHALWPELVDIPDGWSPVWRTQPGGGYGLRYPDIIDGPPRSPCHDHVPARNRYDSDRWLPWLTYRPRTLHTCRPSSTSDGLPVTPAGRIAATMCPATGGHACGALAGWTTAVGDCQGRIRPTIPGPRRRATWPRGADYRG
ncbi:MbtH family protein [Micromonospora sp. NBC_01699]|uniref:MbtH family NRPS accessory protein n=1 Tax=Micromonospora sp. NBC_01699 TaxID=2975984 RepID=UPI002E3823B2|nr:MbtH family NRPS accessory protein [Micromonospora sp. NBC_01699]